MTAGKIRIITPLILTFVLLTSISTFTGSMSYVDKDTRHSENHQDYAPDEIIIKFRNPAAGTIGENTFDDPDAAKLDWPGSLGELNKKFRLSRVERLFKNFKANKERTKALLKKDKALLTKREKHILQRLKRAPEKATVPALDRIYKLQFDLAPGQFIQDVLAAYNNDPAVEYAELNYIVTIDSIPNDPYFSFQWSLHNTGQMYPESGKYNHPPGTADADIDAPEAWDIHIGSSEIIVAVADTGIDYTHRDLQGNIWINEAELNGIAGIDDDGNEYVDDIYGYDFINKDSDPKDDNGHGTHCSGVIAAKSNNGLDISGVCWHAKIMGLKFLGSNGSGPISDAIEAFYYAVNNGADVISNSWSGGYVQSAQDAVDYAYSQGVIVTASAGNSGDTSQHYPADYEHVISVAATNSNDERASFSTYGYWVDIAAPGVDVLSLRATGTSMGTTYDDYTTIASGTSMACPHVSGACALLLAAFPEITVGEVSYTLRRSADPIESGICRSGRLNIFEALLAVSRPKGLIRLEQDVYACLGNINVWLSDSDLKGKGTQEVTLTTSGGDLETIALIETPPSIGIFSGTIPTSLAYPNIEDGVLQILHGQIITARYEDANDGTGSPAVAVDTATADCLGPVIFNVQIDIPGPEPTVTFETSEPSKACVWCGLSCEDPNLIIRRHSIPSTYHSIKLLGVSPQTRYFFLIEAEDVVGNTTLDNNYGQCYNFTTNAPGDINVPADYQTIQEAIDYSWNSGTVRVADGIYTGDGNRDIDFKGKAITVRSENGPENCIVDCDGTSTGFYFHNSEGSNSVLDGFTITGGSGRLVCGQYGCTRQGGGIFCYNSSPIIKNCVVRNNTAHYGGGITCGGGSATITNCIISNNTCNTRGGAIYTFSNATINNCIFRNNLSHGSGGAVYGSKLRINNCLIAENSASRHGGGIYAHCTTGDNIITNCTVVNNSGGARDGYGGGIDAYCSDTTITNCIVRGNSAKYGNQISMWSWAQAERATVTVSYSNIQGGKSSVFQAEYSTFYWEAGNIDADPSFANGPDGDYYLSQIAAGQVLDSPCVDAGSDSAAILGMDICTTRTDLIGDAGIVDMGYHYPATVPNPDIDGNWYVDLLDYTFLAGDWQSCSDVNLLPGDIVKNGCVDIKDLMVLLDRWLDCCLTNATNPQPVNQARGVDPNSTLGWLPGLGALYHDVYFGTDADAVANAGHLSPEFMGTFSGTNFDPCSLELETTYYWRIDEVGSACTTQGEVWNFTTQIGLISWWKFDEGEGSIAYDSAGENDGTIYGAQWTTGQINGALDFDGMNDYVCVPDDYSLDLGTHDLSFAFWFKTNDSAIEQMLTKRSTTTGPSNRVWDGYSAALLADGKVNVHFRHSASSDNDVVVTSNALYNDGNWHYLAGVYTRSANLELYIDGMPEGTPADISYAENKDIDLTQPLATGCRIVYGRSNDLYFNGTIDDVRIYDRALNAEEILQLYQNGLKDIP